MNYQNFFEVFSKSFFEAAGSNSCSFVQYFNSSAFLSRKRVQKYCFTAYTPNHRNTFLQIFCSYSLKSLILKRCRRACFITSGFSWWSVLPYYLIRARKRWKIEKNYHLCFGLYYKLDYICTQRSGKKR